MHSLEIGITESTPEVRLDKASGNFTISGRSLPEEAMQFYKPVLQWINKYIEDPNQTTVFQFNLDYINSASIRALNNILILLEKLFEKKFSVTVVWKYSKEDPEFKEIGEELSEIYKIPFRIEGYEENV